jgi:hypothetical protein
MSKFAIGQRVRLVRPIKVFSRAGMTGRIRELYPEAPSRSGPSINCNVDWDDGSRDGLLLDGFNGFGCHTDQLEPITPKGAQPSEFTTLHDLLNSLEGVAA